VDGEELVRELRWNVVVLMEHGIVGVGRRRWLTTASRDGGGEVAAVVEQRRNRGSEMWPRDRVKVVEEYSWACGGAKKGHGRAGAAAGDRWRNVAASGDSGTTWRGGRKLAEVGRAAGV
jgi:hypothetical protein